MKINSCGCPCSMKTRKFSVAFILALYILILFAPTVEAQEMKQKIISESIGNLGTGSNMFRCGLSHSSGVIYIGTYGPQPAIIWKYNPKVGKLEEVGRPGEYQLDCMVEAPNGTIYIGTAYGAIVYRLDPKTDKITSLGTPPIDSTTWIFTMTCTKAGEIYGAKGVGLFRLDWQNDKLEAIGLIPGDHKTLLPGGSSPIVRALVEAPDGKIYGDTNRWLFRFDPKTRKIEQLADMALVDKATYALFLADIGPQPDNDCIFSIYSRFSGKEMQNYFYAYRTAKALVEPVKIEGFSGAPFGLPSWYLRGANKHLLVSAFHADDDLTRLHELDLNTGKVFSTWDYAGIDAGLVRLHGPGMYYITSTPGKLLVADPEKRALQVLAENPTPVECRSLAASPNGILGTDTYDCGFMFTRDLKSGQVISHGRVWQDDHRCNYGPSVFAGDKGRYFLANHSEATQGLWVTDTQTNRHWRIGEPTIQLVAMKDGSVWGTAGINPPSYEYQKGAVWSSDWQSRPGALFRYDSGAKQVIGIADLGAVGCIAEAPGAARILVGRGKDLLVFEPREKKVIQTFQLIDSVVAIAHDQERKLAYVLLADKSLHLCQIKEGALVVEKIADAFMFFERGFFVLSKSRRLVGLANDNTASVFDPKSGKVNQVNGASPLSAGPAIDPIEDAWYFADKQVMRYRLVD